MLRQSAKHQVGGEFSELTPSILNSTYTAYSCHPRVLQCGRKYLSRAFLKRKPQPEASPNPNCWTNSLGGQSTDTYFVIPKKPLGYSLAGPYIF